MYIYIYVYIYIYICIHICRFGYAYDVCNIGNTSFQSQPAASPGLKYWDTVRRMAAEDKGYKAFTRGLGMYVSLYIHIYTQRTRATRTSRVALV